MRVDAVELRTVRLPFRSPFRTAHGVEHERVAIIVTVRSDGVEGYGEGVMEWLPTYREETVPGAMHLLREALVPDLLTHRTNDPADLGARWSVWRGNPMAKAALELAVWDCHARQLGRPLRELIGGERTAITVGASLGIAPLDATLASVAEHVAQGYRRIKLKIDRGWDVEPVAAVRAAFPELRLTVDANSAYTLGDTEHLAALDEHDLAYVEQPLHWDDLLEHAELAGRLRTPLCLDESLTSPRRVREALRLGACRVVNLKVARVGGLTAALDVHAQCLAADVPIWCGGMFETGVGRAHNLHLSSLPGFTEPGDTASASRTFARDLVEQPLEASNGVMTVPEGPGIGVTLDRPFLERITVAVETLRR